MTENEPIGRSARIILLKWDGVEQGPLVLVGVYKDGKVKRRKHGFPGGGVKPGEDPKAAVLRELHEETGCTAALLGLEPQVQPFATEGRPREMLYYLGNELILPLGTDLKLPETAEMSYLRFRTLAEVSQLAATCVLEGEDQHMLPFDADAWTRYALPSIKGMIQSRKAA